MCGRKYLMHYNMKYKLLYPKYLAHIGFLKHSFSLLGFLECPQLDYVSDFGTMTCRKSKLNSRKVQRKRQKIKMIWITKYSPLCTILKYTILKENRFLYSSCLPWFKFACYFLFLFSYPKIEIPSTSSFEL